MPQTDRNESLYKNANNQDRVEVKSINQKFTVSKL